MQSPTTQRPDVAVAWLALDRTDAPDVLNTYIAFACACAGLTVRDARGKPDDHAADRIAMVAREVQSQGRPFVIALDDVDELMDPSCVSLVDLLLRRGPSNLHLALSGRRIPVGLNVAGPALEGRAEILGTEDLRFSRQDISAFFENGLSRRALVREASRSAGWPLALRVSRNGGKAGAGSDGDPDGMLGNWIESRLLARLRADERDAVLDLGLFGWMDDELLEQALPSASGDALRRVRSRGALDGLLEPVRAGGTRSYRLHALVREHCAAQRFFEDAERARTIHRRIADPLARRGKIVAAMRHAVAAGDPGLAGEIFETAGGVRLWVRHGNAQYGDANNLLPDSVVSASPRLGLARCIHLMLSGRLGEARALYAACSPCGPAGMDEDEMRGEHGDRQIDDCIVRGAMGLYGGESVGSPWMREHFDATARLLRSRRLDAPTRGHFEYALSVLHFIGAEFTPALERLSAARELLGGSSYIRFYADLLHGQIHFWRGQVRDAQALFRRARRVANKHLLLDPVAVLSSEVAARELALERYPATAAEPGGLHRVLTGEGVPFSSFATALSVFVQIGLVSGRAEEVAEFAGKVLVRAYAGDMPAYARLLATARVSALVIAGRLGEAERTWQRASLPTTTASCVDTKRQSLREVESVSEARARLLVARGRFAEARELVLGYHAVARQRALVRTQLRALALAIGLEHRAGDRERAQRCVMRYVRLFAQSPYALAMVLEGTACEEPLRWFLLHAGPDATESESAKLLLAQMRRAEDRTGPSLTNREREILRLLPGNTVKSIAAPLGLSVHGVRYHLRRLFAKFDVSRRAELLERAREMGLVRDHQ
ncbi:MAG: LuxR C-terminal-related transcriptional regulator [Gammaproteobacteria bacterium]|nr:LuxR C-terminal-related transcriptional regulator [Gammaproteobacteria bacterium]